MNTNYVHHHLSPQQLHSAADLIQVDLDTPCIVKHYGQHTIDNIKLCQHSLRTTANMLELVQTLIYDGIQERTFHCLWKRIINQNESPVLP